MDFAWPLQAVEWFELEICRVIRQIGKQACRTQILIMHDYFKALTGSITTTPIGFSKRDSITAR